MNSGAEILIRGELDLLRERIIKNHIAANQKASGQTIRSLKVVLDKESGTLYGRSYFGVLETGRKPGRIPKNFAEILKKWIADKRINVENERSFIWFVSQKTKKEGSKLYRDGGRSDIYSNEIPKTIKTIREKIAQHYRIEVTQIFNNSKVTA